jgi:DNA-directed RNA polymerase subunit RPC12/RpoP
MFALEIIKGLNEKAYQTYKASQKKKKYHKYSCGACDTIILKIHRRLSVNCPLCGHTLEYKGKENINCK